MGASLTSHVSEGETKRETKTNCQISPYGALFSTLPYIVLYRAVSYLIVDQGLEYRREQRQILVT